MENAYCRLTNYLQKTTLVVSKAITAKVTRNSTNIIRKGRFHEIFIKKSSRTMAEQAHPLW